MIGKVFRTKDLEPTRFLNKGVVKVNDIRDYVVFYSYITVEGITQSTRGNEYIQDLSYFKEHMQQLTELEEVLI